MASHCLLRCVVCTGYNQDKASFFSSLSGKSIRSDSCRIFSTNAGAVFSWIRGAWVPLGQRVGTSPVYYLVPDRGIFTTPPPMENQFTRYLLCRCFPAFGLPILRVENWDDPYWTDLGYVRLFKDPWIELHASIAIFSYGLFCLLTVVSLMYLSQRQALLSRKPGFLWALPALHSGPRGGSHALARSRSRFSFPFDGGGDDALDTPPRICQRYKARSNYYPVDWIFISFSHATDQPSLWIPLCQVLYSSFCSRPAFLIYGQFKIEKAGLL